MIKIFRSNNPALLFILFIYGISIRAFYFSHPSVSPEVPGEFLGSLLYSRIIAPINSNPLLLISLSYLITFTTAYYWNFLLTEFRIMPTQNYLPGVCFLLMTAMFQGTTWFTIMPIATLLLTLIIHKLLRVYRNEKNFGDIFDIGFLVSITALLYQPLLFLGLFAFISLALLRPFVVRDWMIGLLGMLIPYILCGTWFFWENQFPLFVTHNINSLRFSLFLPKVPLIELYVKGGLLLALVLISALLLQYRYTNRLVLVRKFVSMQLVLLMVVWSTVLFNKSWLVSNYYILALPASFLVAYYFTMLKKNWMAETIHVLLLGSIFYFEFIKLHP